MNKFLFVDLETTGLDENTCTIIEVAAVVTDNKLRVLEEFSTPVQCPKANLLAMDEWCRTTHTQSRLLEDIEEHGMHLEDVEIELQKLKRRHFPVNKAEICGSSVHIDKRFIDKHMPRFSKELSHRIIDVSSFMLALNKYHSTPINRTATAAHRALSDIKGSISYLKAYLERFT